MAPGRFSENAFMLYPKVNKTVTFESFTEFLPNGFQYDAHAIAKLHDTVVFTHLGDVKTFVKSLHHQHHKNATRNTAIVFKS